MNRRFFAEYRSGCALASSMALPASSTSNRLNAAARHPISSIPDASARFRICRLSTERAIGNSEKREREGASLSTWNPGEGRGASFKRASQTPPGKIPGAKRRHASSTAGRNAPGDLPALRTKSLAARRRAYDQNAYRTERSAAEARDAPAPVLRLAHLELGPGLALDAFEAPREACGEINH